MSQKIALLCDWGWNSLKVREKKFNLKVIPNNQYFIQVYGFRTPYQPQCFCFFIYITFTLLVYQNNLKIY